MIVYLGRTGENFFTRHSDGKTDKPMVNGVNEVIVAPRLQFDNIRLEKYGNLSCCVVVSRKPLASKRNDFSFVNCQRLLHLIFFFNSLEVLKFQQHEHIHSIYDVHKYVGTPTTRAYL